MRATCAISGIRFDSSFLDNITLPHTAGYFHPVFALPNEQLYKLYTSHCKGYLTPKDSYLLFMAFLHSSGKIEWKYPASLNPNDTRTRTIIENNLAQLISVLEKTAIISHPSFTQPSFVVNHHNSELAQIPYWIEAWNDNIEDFNLGIASDKEQADLISVTNKLSHLILSGEDPMLYAHVIADWASITACFPIAKDEEWKRTIRSCFNMTKMFNTPLSLLKEIKDYCECNIESGSIHSHSLYNVLKEGINRHVDYLGGGSLALGYTLLSPDSVDDMERERKGEAEIKVILASAPEHPPREEDYPTSLAFLKAKLAYRVARNVAVKSIDIEE